MEKIKNITLGADPELFLEKFGEVISAEGKIGGTKYLPQYISDEGHAIQEDNVMVEFNIPPSATEEDFVDNINQVLEHLETVADIHDANLLIQPSAELDPMYLNTEQAKTFGCEPDFCVYIRDVNKPPKSTTNLRTCGGHIHVGYEDANIETSEKIIIAMDIVLGLESLMLDNDTRRREMYGKAGAVRFKEYGCEYRTLSNFWIATDELKRWAYNKTLQAIELVNDGIIDKLSDEFKTSVRKSIDENNIELAVALTEQLEKLKIKELIKK